ncbi:MAG: LPS assembly protein LptD [Vicinamibacteria bacterium]|nr:LPS assembly protein LptD [Vicinamibacteria bacterium]
MLAAPAAAQSAAPSPTPPAAGPVPAVAVEGAPVPPAAAPAPTPPVAGPGDIRIRAEKQGSRPDGRFVAEGFVDLVAGDVRIQADYLEMAEEPRPDGTTGRTIEARGNVVFVRGEERLAGDSLKLDLEANTGTFENATGYVTPGVFIEAKSIERVDADTYRIKGGKFTSCAQPNPRWNFTAGSATLDIDDKIRASNVVFKVYGVPALYFPYFAYPIQNDQRSSGLLFPSFGYSSSRGFQLASGLFWAMSRSADQTLMVENYSKFGFGMGHELRWMGDSPSRGTLRTYGLKPQGGGDLEWDVDWNAQQTLPGGGRASLNVRKYSSIFFQQSFQDALNYVSSRSERGSFTLQKSLSGFNMQAFADTLDTYYGDALARTNRHLPSLRVTRSPWKIGGTGIVVGGEARAERLQYGIGEDELQSFDRYDVAPEISRPFSLPFLQVNPRASVRYTYYSASLDDTGYYASEPALDRSFAEGSVELRGPQFYKVFETPDNFYSDKWKHTIGPEFLWVVRTPVEEYASIPKFDEVDYQFLGTNQVMYALVNRVYVKRDGAGGKPTTWELLTWRLQQTYYAKIGASQNEFDPIYLTAYFGPGGEPAHYSPLQSRLRIRPTAALSLDVNFEYDTNFKQTRSRGASLRWQASRGNLLASWYRTNRVAKKVENRVAQSDTLRGSARFDLLPGRLSIEGGADYDVLRETFLSSRGRLRYDVQCCGFIGEVVQYNYNRRQERQIRFSIELANVGSVGNFQDANNAASGAWRP